MYENLIIARKLSLAADSDSGSAAVLKENQWAEDHYCQCIVNGWRTIQVQNLEFGIS
jgi:hypothetical protein